MRCDVCRTHQPDSQLEPAHMRGGMGNVCRDGYACAQRANGAPRLFVVGAVLVRLAPTEPPRAG
jgi:hypothetical protein